MELLSTDQPDNSTFSNGTLSPGNNQSDYDPINFFSTAGSKVMAASTIIFSIVGTAANLLTILALFKDRKLRGETASWLIISLSASDLIMCGFHLPRAAEHQLSSNHENEELGCRIETYLLYANGFSSVMCLTAIAINRYVLIVHYYRYGRIFSRVITWTIILFIWIFPHLVLLLPLLEVWGQFGFDTKMHVCKMLEKNGSSPHLTILISLGLLPLFVMIFCYAQIWIRLRMNRLSLQRRGSDRVQRHQKPGFRLTKEEMQLTRTVLYTIAGFLLSFIPVSVAGFLDLQRTWPEGYIASCILFHASFTVNFLIYAVCNRQYRRAYLNLLGLDKCKTGTVSVPSTQVTATDIPLEIKS